MVAEPWILKMGNQVSNNLKNVLYLDNSTKSSNKKQGPQERQIIGILSFEVANVMSKIMNLHKSLSDHDILKLKNEILKSEGIKTLVSSDEKQLLELALVEKLDDLNRVATVVSRLGKKCTIPALQGFEHVYGDIISGVIDIKELGFLVKDMDSMVRKMERYVNSTVRLYREMEVMNELESATKKFQQNQHEESRKAFEQKLIWQRQDVRHLKDVSLWNRTFDKIVELLARTVCTVYARIYIVFGDGHLRGTSNTLISKSQIGFTGMDDDDDDQSSQTFDSISIANSAKSDNTTIFSSFVRPINVDPLNGENRQFLSNSINGTKFQPKSRLLVYAPPKTVGGSALALHYANVIIVIEKLLRYPHLVGDEARDDLYQMLPTTLRKTLKAKLKSYTKDLAIYDAPLAHDWRERLGAMLMWLAPLAHNMIKWQSERNFEQHQIVTRTNVLLLQTLYFADREKTEEVICEVLVGLNYICRYEQQQNALLDCASSFDFDDCMDWQSQIGASIRS
ncbi:hypothetical protein DH2020_043533 [Rehmannia glutinosa]|uniref:DUF668 domain-containing protein n=1 Tax=Rehmannia glutinosa TaxID=99300 RepID=A0ABR0UK95_REHGL